VKIILVGTDWFLTPAEQELIKQVEQFSWIRIIIALKIMAKREFLVGL
jgi:hypothetical protein